MKTHRTQKKRGKFGIRRQHFLLFCLDMTTQTQPPPKFVGAAWPWREHARHKIKPLGWTLKELMSPHLCLLITSGKQPIPPQVSMEFFSCVQSTATDMLILSPASHLANSRNITKAPKPCQVQIPWLSRRHPNLSASAQGSIPVAFCSFPEWYHNQSVSGKHN